MICFTDPPSFYNQEVILSASIQSQQKWLNWRAGYPMTLIGVNAIQEESSLDGHKSLSMHLSQAGFRA